MQSCNQAKEVHFNEIWSHLRIVHNLEVPHRFVQAFLEYF